MAETAAQHEREIYRLLEQPFHFVSLVYESHGRACVETQNFVFESAIAAAKRALGFGATEGSPSFIKIRNGFLGQWSKEISVAVQRSNARIVVHGREAALGLGLAGHLEEDYVDELQEVL